MKNILIMGGILVLLIGVATVILLGKDLTTSQEVSVSVPDARFNVDASGNKGGGYVLAVTANTDAVGLDGWQIRSSRMNLSQALSGSLQPSQTLFIHLNTPGESSSSDTEIHMHLPSWNQAFDLIELVRADGSIADTHSFETRKSGFVTDAEFKYTISGSAEKASITGPYAYVITDTAVYIVSGTKAYEIEGADTKSFTLVLGPDDASPYSRDSKNVYFMGKILTGVEASSFRMECNGDPLECMYLDDKNNKFSPTGTGL